jgi:L,D-transpeptidase catalytic domain
MKSNISRRSFIKIGAVSTMLAASGTALAGSVKDGLSPDILHRAMAAFSSHSKSIMYKDRIGIVDFSRPSSSPRLFIVDITTGASQSHLVAHGRGSDPTHTGWAKHFSNEPGSFASSTGAYVTGIEYAGHHGRSMRLAGLDPENCNAESRAIVVHAAWYVTSEIAMRAGMLGRSEGCFAVSGNSLGPVLDQLGAGRLLYAAKA